MLEQNNNLRLSFLVPDWNVPAHVLACTSLRQASDPANAYSGFNLASHVGDASEQLVKNREILEHSLALPGKPVWLNQVHSNRVIEVFSQTSEKIANANADAAFAAADDVVCAVLTADCLPLLLTDSRGRGVAAIHAGWRGLASGIVRNSIEKFCSRLDIIASDCVVWLGPGISQKYFEVGSDVYDKFATRYDNAADAFIKKNGQKYDCDLYHLARMELDSLGVINISGGDQCTYSQDQDFYSFRRHTHYRNKHQKSEQSNCGRMATLIWLSSNNRIKNKD